MTQRILIDQGFQTSKMLAQAVQDMIVAYQSSSRVQKILDKAQWGAPADWAAVAGELGLINRGTYTAVQQAQDLYGIFQAASLRLDHVAITVELSRLDQG